MKLKAYKYRIYPNAEQKLMLTKYFGCVRYVWNFFLAMRKQEYHMFYVNVDEYTCKAELTKLKAEPGYEWLKECDSAALQAAIEYLQKAFESFWSHNAGYPKFKSKHDHCDSYTSKAVYSKTGHCSIRLESRYIILPKIGKIRTKVSRPTEGRIKTATVSRTPADKYYVSVICEIPDMQYTFAENRTICMDLGIKDYCVTNEKIHIHNPKPLEQALRRLKHEQRSLSRKTKGSHRYERQRRKVAKLHEHVCNIRKDFQHQLSTSIIRQADIIGVETLAVTKMLAEGNSGLAHRITDCGWGEFLRQLEYKAEWYGRTFVQVGQYYPSSQLCSSCGYQNPDVKDVSIRTWTCPACGMVHDRDENAAFNIEHEVNRILTMRMKAPASA